MTQASIFITDCILWNSLPGPHETRRGGRETPLWPRDDTVASHLAGPGSIPGRINFPDWVFSGVFLQPLDKCREKLRPQPSPFIFGHQKSFITGANDLRCWRALKHKLIRIDGGWGAQADRGLKILYYDITKKNRFGTGKCWGILYKTKFIYGSSNVA